MLQPSRRAFLKCSKQTRFYSSLRTIRHLGKVSPPRFVPEHIMKPPYIENPSYKNVDDSGAMVTIPLINEETLPKIRESCSLARDVLDYACSLVRPGITTEEIDELVHEKIIQSGAYPSPLGYMNFPKSICTSLNNVMCHGIPNDQPIVDGDIMNIDITVFFDGYHGDCSETVLVGNSTPVQIRQLVQVAREARDSAIAQCGPGVPLRLIGSTITKLCRQYGYSSPELLTGHGIGQVFHAEPAIFHWENQESGVMVPGQVFTIEPVICLGEPHFWTADDQWTLFSEDNKWNAQFEHTILITENGHEILTNYKNL